MSNFRNTRFKDIYEHAIKYVGEHVTHSTNYMGDIEIHSYSSTIQIERDNIGVWISPNGGEEEILLISDGCRCVIPTENGLKVHTATVGDFLDICHLRFVEQGLSIYDANSLTVSKVEQVLLDFVKRI